MTEQDQRIALCEWMGYHLEEESNGCKVWYGPNSLAQRGLPDTNSLDVLHKMEMKLNDIQYDAFITHLEDITVAPTKGPGEWRFPSATAAQRREALCRTLWPERFT